MDFNTDSEPIELKKDTTDEIPITLYDEDDNILENFTDRIWFMVKKTARDTDDDAIISKEITIVNPDGTPYHGVLELDLTDSGNPVGKYEYDLKIKEGSEDWKSSDIGYFNITQTVRHGTPS